MNAYWVLVIFVVSLVAVVGILAWWDAAIQVNPDVATVDALKALAERVDKLERIAHEVPWWLDDDMKGVN